MKKSHKYLFVTTSLFASLLLGSCGSKKDEGIDPSSKVSIHVLHQEDYMDMSLIEDFEAKYPECKVVFDTTDTNETLYNELRTGKASYNLVTVSEYMIQRMASEDLIQPIKLKDNSVYKKNVSPWLTNSEGTGRIDNINIVNNVTGETGVLSEYTAGYMWGTLGTIVNPYYKTYAERGMDKDTIINDLRGIDGWSKFWDPSFKGTHSIKDSMRDSYALGVFEIYKDQFLDPSISYEKKNEIFNSHSKETIQAVEDILIDLKSNIFGFEVDSGKNDIVTGKIGMNLAWSGDAAFSILKGEYYPGADEEYDEEKPEDKKTKLYYNIPKSGSNIWFDGFAMPKTTDPNSREYEYTLKFIDFISEPSNAVRNMENTGFTSFISGNGLENNPVVDFVTETFDWDEENVADKTGYQEYDLSYFFAHNEGEEFKIHVHPDEYEGRLIVAQYPEASDIDHLYIMEDYGKDNGKIVQMWEDIKVNPLPLWVDIFLISFFVILIGYLASYQIIKKRNIRKRKALRNKD